MGEVRLAQLLCLMAVIGVLSSAVINEKAKVPGGTEVYRKLHRLPDHLLAKRQEDPFDRDDRDYKPMMLIRKRDQGDYQPMMFGKRAPADYQPMMFGKRAPADYQPMIFG